MTDIALTPDVAPAPAVGDEIPPEPTQGTLAPDEQRRRRRRVLLLLVLSLMAIALLAFSGWYLLFRKPIGLIPLPGFDIAPMPNYSYSLYGMNRPTGIAVNADGSRIYVTQTAGEPAVFVLDNQGQMLNIISAPDTTVDHAFVFLALNPVTGELYVSDRPAAKIHIYDASGALLRDFEPPASLLGWQPLGVNFTATGHLLVTDAADNTVHEFDNDQLVRTVGTDGQFSFPSSAIVDAAGRLYVSDSNNGRLFVFGRDGAPLGVIRRGPSEGDLGLPRGMALDDQGLLYVVDTSDQTVKVYRPSSDPTALPRYEGLFGQAGIGEGMFRFPNAVATDTRGRVYVADWNNDRIQVWSH
jgi:DNA-binding beta-propeller fold protein YncE